MASSSEVREEGREERRRAQRSTREVGQERDLENRSKASKSQCRVESQALRQSGSDKLTYW